MATSPWIATWLDEQFLARAGTPVLPPLAIGLPAYPPRPGTDVARDLQGRLLLKYVRRREAGSYGADVVRPSWATPTPYATQDVNTWLLLPLAHETRRHVVLLEPALIPRIAGPYWVAMGRGIQYFLPDGFPADAVVVPGSPGGHWAIEVR